MFNSSSHFGYPTIASFDSAAEFTTAGVLLPDRQLLLAAIDCRTRPLEHVLSPPPRSAAGTAHIEPPFHQILPSICPGTTL